MPDLTQRYAARTSLNALSLTVEGITWIWPPSGWPIILDPSHGLLQVFKNRSCSIQGGHSAISLKLLLHLCSQALLELSAKDQGDIVSGIKFNFHYTTDRSTLWWWVLTCPAISCSYLGDTTTTVDFGFGGITIKVPIHQFIYNDGTLCWFGAVGQAAGSLSYLGGMNYILR
jgi:hypothetical protein